jgi:hypothetical protein
MSSSTAHGTCAATAAGSISQFSAAHVRARLHGSSSWRQSDRKSPRSLLEEPSCRLGCASRSAPLETDVASGAGTLLEDYTQSESSGGKMGSEWTLLLSLGSGNEPARDVDKLDIDACMRRASPACSPP